jgi:hypothetical protein
MWTRNDIEVEHANLQVSYINARSKVWSSNWNLKVGLVGCRDCINYTSGPNFKGEWGMKFD